MIINYYDIYTVNVYILVLSCIFYVISVLYYVLNSWDIDLNMNYCLNFICTLSVWFISSISFCSSISLFQFYWPFIFVVTVGVVEKFLPNGFLKLFNFFLQSLRRKKNWKPLIYQVLRDFLKNLGRKKMEKIKIAVLKCQKLNYKQF